MLFSIRSAGGRSVRVSMPSLKANCLSRSANRLRSLIVKGSVSSSVPASSRFKRIFRSSPIFRTRVSGSGFGSLLGFCAHLAAGSLTIPLTEYERSACRASNSMTNIRAIIDKYFTQLPTRLKSLRRDKLHQIAHAAGIAPLVIVPGEDLDHAATDYLRVLGVNDRRI